MPRRRIGREIGRQLFIVAALVALWVFLWDTISVTHILTGTVVALLVVRLFYLPPIDLPVRLSPLHFLRLLAWFLWALVIAGAQVAWVAVRPARVAPGSILAVDLHTRSDLLLTLVAQISGLIPGTFVVDIDRTRSIVYLHALSCNTQESIDHHRSQTLLIERMLISAFGSPHDIAALNEWRRSQGLEPVLRGWSLDDMRSRRGRAGRRSR